MSFEPVHTERLTLRTYEPADAEKLLRYYGNPDVCRFQLHEAWTIEDAHESVAKRIARTDFSSEALALAVEHKGRVVGNIEAWLVGGSPALAEMGWTFSPDVTGRGFATEAVAALLDHVFSHPQVHRVTAEMDGRNVSSARLAERVGMRREAYFRQNWWSKGEWTDTLVYAVLREDR